MVKLIKTVQNRISTADAEFFSAGRDTEVGRKGKRKIQKEKEQQYVVMHDKHVENGKY